MKPNDLPIESVVVNNLLKLKQALEDIDVHQFNMAHWRVKTDCGTTYCLLGAYVEKYGAETGLQFSPGGGRIELIGNKNDSYDEIRDSAKVIGITDKEAENLFIPGNYFLYGHHITKKDVMIKLNALISKYRIQS